METSYGAMVLYGPRDLVLSGADGEMKTDGHIEVLLSGG